MKAFQGMEINVRCWFASAQEKLEIGDEWWRSICVIRRVSATVLHSNYISMLLSFHKLGSSCTSSQPAFPFSICLSFL
jgi:hypothetical protein